MCFSRRIFLVNHFFAHFYTLHLCLKSQIEFQMSVDKLQITSVDRENSVTHCKQIIEQISYFFDDYRRDALPAKKIFFFFR